MKKLFASFFALTLTLTLTASSAFAFPDTQNHPYRAAIDFIESRGIVEGYPDGNFRPNQLIERYEMLKIVIESIYSDQEIAGVLDEYKAKNYFYVDLIDVPMGQWFSPYVRIGIRDRVVEGYPNGRFQGSDEVNFVEALKILMQTYNIRYNENTPIWYEDMVDIAADLNIIPLDITSFGQEITRAQMADMITRLLKLQEGTLDVYLGPAKNIRQTYKDIENGNNQLNGYDEFFGQDEDQDVNQDDDDDDDDEEEDDKAQCEDGIDNDKDGNVDKNDAGCHKDHDVNNSDSYEPQDNDESDEPEAPKPQCSDGLDNDNDQRTDVEDPGCWADVADKNTYDPQDNDESDEPLCSDNKDNDNDGYRDKGDAGCHTDNDINNVASYDPADDDETDVFPDPEPFYNDKNEENAQLLVNAIEAFAFEIGLYPGLPEKAECLVNDKGAGLDLKQYIEGGVIPSTPKPNQDLQVGDLFCLQSYFYIPLEFEGLIRNGYVLIAPMTDPNRANFLLSDIGMFSQDPTAEDVMAILEAYDTSKIADAPVEDRILLITN